MIKNQNRFVLPDGYKDLGYQNGWRYVYFDEDGNLASETGKPNKTFGHLPKDHPEYCACKDKKHNVREIDNGAYLNRGTDTVYVCDECKLVWHVDSSG